MKWILDTNVLFAAVNANHASHAVARAWLDQARKDGWGVAVETFLGVIRLLMNPRAMADRPCKAADALRLVRGELGGRHVGRIIADVTPSDSFLRKAQGHGQIMDFYLVNVAFEHSAKLVTLDAGIRANWPNLTAGI